MQKGNVLSRTVRAGSRTYFFDVKESVKGDKYLKICESRKIEGKYQKNRIMVFKDDFRNFFATLNEIETELNKDTRS